jgi:hypothetical protein
VAFVRGRVIVGDWPRGGVQSYLGREKAAAVPEPTIIRVTRPYRSVDEYLQAEADTIDSRGMLLVDAEPLPKDTMVRFVVSLASGEAVIRAEGVTRSHVASSASSPGGLRVWFKRFGVATKTIIDRAAAVKASRHAAVSDLAARPAGASGPRDAPRTAGAPSSALPDRGLDGLRTRPRRSVPPPPNREELLGRLRARVRGSDAEQDVRRKP